MKFQNILLISSLSLTATAGLYQGGEEKKAEEVYKSIKVMKGMPASEVIPSMKFMCASLKVNCDFCHKEDDFSDDTPKMKEAARHMIEMQKEINAKNFNGRIEVTCNTCHNGSPSPARVPSLEGISRRTINRSAAAVPVADVLKKFQTGTGDLKAVVLEGKIKGLGPQTMTTKITEGAPNKFLWEAGQAKYGFDGTVTWAAEGGKASAVPPESAGELQNFGRFFRGEHAFDYLGALRFGGTDKIGGKDVTVLRAGAQGSKVSTDLYFETATGLLLRVVSYTSTPLGSIPSSVDYSDFHKVGDAMVPYTITRSGGKEPVVVTIEKSTANPNLPADFFALPKG